MSRVVWELGEVANAPAPAWNWTDITQYVLGEEGVRQLEAVPPTLRMQLDNSSALFEPGRKVRVIAGGVDYGVFTVETWEQGRLRMVSERKARARRSRMHAAYRRRRA